MTRCHALLVLTFTLAALPAAGPPTAAAPPGFRLDVLPVLSKAGCNQGTCHGNQNGKNGFKLSLRGQDPDFDYESLTRDTAARRCDTLRPDNSLLLLKATAALAHEGGRRFSPDSPEYRAVRGWIAAGCPPEPAGGPAVAALTVSPAEQVVVEPADRVRLSVRARFRDGSERDVTALACYEASNLVATVEADGEVRRRMPGETAILVRYLDGQATVRLAFIPARPGFVWPAPPEANFVDGHVFAKLRTLRIPPSGLCPDHVFLRRVYLDLLGTLPTAAEARAFLADTDPAKRGRLVDRLLGRPEFADFWALKWADLLRNEEKVLDRKGVQVFHQWIRQSLAEGKPLNEFARELVAARGSSYASPPANFYRALRDPQSRAETVGQVFLGVRLQCAKCHNHPFDRWTQNDYHEFAAFFARVQYRIVENNRQDRFDLHEFDGEQVVWLAREGEVLHPRTRAACPPRFLGGGPADAAGDRLQQLADWIARPDNPFFARAQVNRVWAHLMGRGLVEPLDDFRPSNPAVNEPLLDALARDFVAHGFDLRHLIRTIILSRTYQLSSVPNEGNREDVSNFSHVLPRPLQAEQLLDALAAAAGTEVRFAGYPAGLRAVQLPGVRAVRRRDQREVRAAEPEAFLRTFGKPERLLSCECERGETPTLNQAFQLISGPLVDELLARPDNRLGRLLSRGLNDRELVEELTYVALSRPPSAAELQAGVELLARAPDRRAAAEDLLWGLVNSKTFLLRP